MRTGDWRGVGGCGILLVMSDEPVFVVRDAGGAIYGPANAATLRQWIGEGRITGQMHVAVQGTKEFVEAAQMPELAGAFPEAQRTVGQQAGPVPVATQVPVATTSQNV